MEHVLTEKAGPKGPALRATSGSEPPPPRLRWSAEASAKAEGPALRASSLAAGCRCLRRALAAQDVHDPVVPLVARVLVPLMRGALHRILALPRDVPRGRIIDR